MTLRCRPHRQPGHTCAGEIELSVITSNAVDAAADDDEVDDEYINELFWLTISGAAIITLFRLTIDGAIGIFVSLAVAATAADDGEEDDDGTPDMLFRSTIDGAIGISVSLDATATAADDGEEDDDDINELLWLTISGAASVVIVVVVVISARGLTASFRHAFGNPTSTQQQVSLTLLQPSGLTRRL